MCSKKIPKIMFFSLNLSLRNTNLFISELLVKKMFETYLNLEITLIATLQNILPPPIASFLQHFSNIIAPHATFWLFFPILHFFHVSNGESTRVVCSKLVFAIMVSDYLNMIMKWMFFGNRPYWYDTSLNQFKGTCETGPGNPSGHCMVSGAAITVLILCNSFIYKGLYRKLFASTLLFVAISRLYLAAHFPHQVILGSILGYYTGRFALRFDSGKLTEKKFWFFIGIFIFISAILVHTIFNQLLGIDLDWTIPKAESACKNKDWVHKATSPINTVFKITGACLGMAFYKVERAVSGNQINNFYFKQIFKFAACVGLFYGTGYGQRHYADTDVKILYYGASCLQYFIVPVVLGLG